MSNVQIWLAGCGILVALIGMWLVVARRDDVEPDPEPWGDVPRIGDK